MIKLLKFQRTYFFLAVILFITEVLIALYVTDGFVRPYVGDFLVVILIYCFVKAFISASQLKVAVGVLLFAFLVEILQYLNLLDLLDLRQSALARVILGSSFEWIDMIAYTAGVVFVLFAERIIRQSSGVLKLK